MTRLALALVSLLAAGCGGNGDEQKAVPPPPLPAQAAEQGRLAARPHGSVADEGEAGLRTIDGATLYVPPGDGPNTLVLALHGAGSDPAEPMALLRPYADDAGLILLAPKSKGGTWD